MNNIHFPLLRSVDGSLIVRLTLSIDVIDEVSLWSFFAQRYQRSRDSRWVPTPAEVLKLGLAGAVLESVVYSNENPPSRSYGLVFLKEFSGAVIIRGAPTPYGLLARYLTCSECTPQRDRDPIRVRATLYVEVTDELALWGFAEERYRRAWFCEMFDDKDPEELTLESAILEAIAYSNDNPSPDTYGIEFVDRATKVISGRPRTYAEIAALREQSRKEG